MKRPLNYAILKYFTTVNEGSVDDVIEALKGEYSTYKAFKRKSMVEAIMTAEGNGLLEETRYELKNGEVVIYYRANDDQKNTINAYIS